MNRLFIHNAIFRICSGPIFGVLVYLIILLINNSLLEVDKLFSSGELYVSMALSYISFESMRWIISRFEKRKKEWSTVQQRVMLQLGISVGISTLLVWLSIAAYFKWVIGFSIGASELNLFLGIYAITGMLYNLLYFSHYYVLRENKLKLEEERKLQEKLEADFHAFKNEINPDLLYESLENLILTLHHNADLAEEQIDYLAGIYRYSLVNRSKELISLQEELEATDSLVRLLNFRYDQNINVVGEIADAKNIHLIPGSLLVTLDTTVRNTLISKQNPLVIRLYVEDDDYVVMQHALNDRLLVHQESKDSFSRLQRSYSFFSDKPFVQVKAGRENFIKFPLVRITSENTIPQTA